MPEKLSSDARLARELPLIKAAERQEFDSGAGSSQIDLWGATRPSDALPSTIGGYHVVRKLGEGGMGAVYEVKQEHPRRAVALKVIRGGQYVGEHRIKLFDREIHTLARLKHSHIAAIYEAGRTDDGQHFFAMELVRGVPLMAFARRRQLSMRARLELFDTICQAINYAHQRGVIHRDLKPSNILINADGHPKILDFGLAKMTDSDVTVTSVQTEVGRIQGTLPYMSPEQARGNPDRIDLRSDVYALGVILYQLLTEQLPYDVSGPGGLPEAVRVICEQAPRKPSTISKTLRGDVETIALKALEKEPSRRYQSASTFADDVQRYLTNQPILARPPGAMYQLKKLVTRHKVTFAFIAALFVLTVGSSIWMTVLYGQAGTERDRAIDAEQLSAVRLTQAQKARDESDSVTEFLADMLAALDPAEQGKDVTVRQVLDQAAETLGDKFKDKPLIEARLRATMGRAYNSLGRFASAEDHLRTAETIFVRELGDGHPNTLRVRVALARAVQQQGRLNEAAALNEQTLRQCRRVLGDDHADTLTAAFQRVYLLNHLGRMSEAGHLLYDTYERSRRTLGDAHPQTIKTLHALSTHALRYRDNTSRAENLCAQALKHARAVLDEQHPTTLAFMTTMGTIFKEQRRFRQAERMMRTAYEGNLRLFGEEHTATLGSMLALAGLLKDQDRLDEAEALFREALGRSVRIHGTEHANTLGARGLLANVLTKRGRFGEAARIYAETLPVVERVLGRVHPTTAYYLDGLGFAWQNLGRYAEAEAMHRRALGIYRGGLADGHVTTTWSLRCLVKALVAQGKLEQAQPLAEELLELRRQAAEHADANVYQVNAYARALLTIEPAGLRDPELGLEFALEAFEKSTDAYHYNRYTLGLAYEVNGEHDKAVEMLQRALARIPIDDSTERSDYEAALARLLEEAGDPGQTELGGVDAPD